jgi:hypothetical protein
MAAILALFQKMDRKIDLPGWGFNRIPHRALVLLRTCGFATLPMRPWLCHKGHGEPPTAVLETGMQRPVRVAAVIILVAAGCVLLLRYLGPGPMPGRESVAAANPVPALSWSAADLTRDQIMARIANADVSEPDRVQLMAAFTHAKGDTVAMQSVLDKLKLALEAAKKKN